MKAVLAAAPLVAAGLALAGAAAAAQPAHDNCFLSRDMAGHTVVDDHTLYVRVLQHDVYRITASNACFAGAMSSDPLITRSPPGSTRICKPIDLDLGIRSAGGFPNHCIVDSIIKLTPAEVAALPKRARP